MARRRKPTKNQRHMQQRRAASQMERQKLLETREKLLSKWDKNMRGNSLAEKPEGVDSRDVSNKQLRSQIKALQRDLKEEQLNIMGSIDKNTQTGEAQRLKIKSLLVGATPDEEDNLKDILDNIHKKKEAGESVDDLYAQLFQAADYAVTYEATKQIEEEIESGDYSRNTPF